jgi:hypothetical protein
MEIRDNNDSDNFSFCDICSNQGQLHDRFAKHLEEVDQLLHEHAPREVSWISGSLSTEKLEYHFPEVTLHINFQRHGNPMISHKIENKTLGRKWVDGLRAELREEYNARSSALDSVMELLVLVLDMAEHVAAYLDGHNYPDRELKMRLLEDKAENAHSVDIDNVQDVVSRFIGTKPKVFLDSLMERLDRDGTEYLGISRVVHCEAIARSNLTQRFLQAQETLRAKLEQFSSGKLRECIPHELRRTFTGNSGRIKSEMIDYLCKPRLTYHGTKASSVPSIVQHGFLKPGSLHPKTRLPVPVRCGSTYGLGIYTSPDPFFAMSYAREDRGADSSYQTIYGSKLVVCLTLMGRSAAVLRSDEWRSESDPMLDADSHCSSNGLEYIVFDSAHVLPCYVIHMDWGQKRTQEIVTSNITALKMQRYAERRDAEQERRRNEYNCSSPGDLKRAKAERLAQARKFFAYGFGPVAGSRIVIEDIADVDDDEEDYGDYQLQRVDAHDPKQKSVWEDDEFTGAGIKDQYRHERRDGYVYAEA